MSIKTKLLVAATLLIGATAYAGSFTSDFSNPNQAGFTPGGSGTLADGSSFMPLIENGHLVLTYAVNSLQGTMALDDLDGGAAIEAFTAKFKLKIGPGSGNPADGFCFYFGPDFTAGSNFGEEGPGGTAGISVVFDIYDNGSSEAPALDIKVGSTVLAHTMFAKADMVTSKYEDVSIQLTRSGMLNMSYKGAVLYTNLVLSGFSPVAGIFAFGARTGGENAEQFVDDLSITTTVQGAVTAPTVTVQPVNQSISERSPASFSIAFDGSSPVTFQWTKNNVAIPDATNSAVTLTRVSYADNGAKIKCVVTNPAGTVNSQEATLTVAADTTAPTLASVAGSADMTHVTVVYSEPVTKATAEVLANYSIAGLAISAASLSTADDTKVTLTTAAQTEGAAYTLVVNNVKDTAVAGNTIAAGSSKTFHGFVSMTGYVVIDYFDGYTSGIAGLEAFIDGGQAPTRTVVRSDAQSESWENGSNYGARLQGVIVAPEAGDYVFHIASDDQSYLYLSTDDKPANLSADPICQVTGWVNQRDWTDTASASVGTADVMVSAPVTLVKGKKYYLRALQIEGGGGDGVAVGWELPSAPGTIAVIPGSAFIVPLNTDNSTVTISQQPVATQGVDGKTVTFKVAATGTSDFGNTVAYQWQKGGQNITGATAASYTTPKLVLATDNGTKYKCLVSVPGKQVASTEVTLTVIADTFPPVLVGAGAAKNAAGTFDVGVSFDEELDKTSAETAANYTLSAGTISAAKYYNSSPGVALTVSGLTAGTKYTVTVKNVADLKANKITSASKEFTASKMAWGVVGADELGAGNGLVAVADNGFDVYSDSIGEWGTYDEATFVYEEITGDFDKKLRVEYQDNSSQWSRAGLIVRDVTNFGVDRATQDAGAAGLYQKVHVNPTGPTLTGPGTAGNNAWEGNRRITTGAATTSAGGGGNPLYPSAWCRLQRVGETFTIFRSDDGQNWTQLGTTTFDPPMPAKVFVGPEFAPENGNITETASRGMWVAKIRNYGDTFRPAQPARTYSIGLNFGADELSGSASLKATDVAGVSAVSQPNWNNLSTLSGTNKTIVADSNDKSEATTVTVAFTSNNTWTSTGRGEENNLFSNDAYANTYDRTLMTGYLDTGAPTTTTVDISGIPAALTAKGYDVYVYALGGVGGRGGAYRIKDGSGTALTSYIQAQSPTNSTDYVQVPASSDPKVWGAGNYMVFSGLTAAHIVVEGTTAAPYGFGGTARAPINAVQLVTPASAAPVVKPNLAYEMTATGLKLTYDGTLQSADTVTGVFTDVAGATSPYTAATGAPQKYYRARK